MKLANDKGKISIIFGSLTFILFSIKPYILDLIEPAKSIGQIIGENTKDLIESIHNEENTNKSITKREFWSNIITMSSFILFGITAFYSINLLQDGSRKWYGIGAGILSLLGIGIYLFHIGIGLIAFIVVSVLIVLILIMGGG